MKSELHLMIIWKNALSKRKEILDDLSKKFKIRNKFLINWSNENFSSNLSRFYGTSLPDNSAKEQHCGRGEFLLVVFEDTNPIYDYRNTSHGKDFVNTNVFDKKDLYREWTGGTKWSHMIHATNSKNEFNHDITLLFGLNEDDFQKKYRASEKVISIKKDVVGAEGWNNLEEIFYILNNTNNYVILRDFENDLSEYPQNIKNNSSSLDIDILSENAEDAKWILNVNKTVDKCFFSNLKNNKIVYFDIKDARSGYYCNKMSIDILNSKKMNNYYFVPNSEYHYYSCLYHSLVHKFNFENEYNERLEYIFGKRTHNSKKDVKYYISKCSDWLMKKNYSLDVYIDEFEKFNITNIKQFDSNLNVNEVIYKYKSLMTYKEKLFNQFEEYRQENSRLTSELNSLYNSRSWRVTKPLRGIRRAVSNSKKMVGTK